MHFKPSAGLSLAFLTAGGFIALPSAQAQNLVTNPGFETGDFTGWTTVDASQGSRLFVRSSDPHTGSYEADFGSVSGLDDSISQTLPTIAGENYTISFFLAANAGTGNEFHATFGNDTLLEINNTPNFTFPYAEYSFTDTATSTATTLTFAGQTPPGYFYLDDISVTDAGPAAVPEASSVVSLGVLLSLGLGGMVVSIRRKTKAAR